MLKILFNKIIPLLNCRMLRCGILSLIRSSSIQSSRFYRYHKKGSDDLAGVRHRKKALGDDDVEAFMEDSEEEYEADFEKLPATMREHEREMERQREKIKLKIIERKYFRTKQQPSFLTWAEKEQIRHLNRNDPEQWNVQRLAESFPATTDTILKILKAKWTPNSMKRVQTHDESIKKNWQAFKANKFENLDPELKEHLEKFSQRKFSSLKNAYALSKNDQIKFQFPKPKHQEFSHIISSCKPWMKATEIAENKSEQIEADERGNMALMVNETSMAQKIELPINFRSRNMRCDEIQKKLGIDVEKTDEDNFHIGFPKEPNSVKSLHKQSNIKPAIGLEDYEEIDLCYSQYSKESSEVESVSDEGDVQIINMSPAQKITKYEVKAKSSNISDGLDLEPFVDKIVIPAEVRKKGAMYKVNDCFYDDNGYFLFKVPGLDSVWY